MSEPPRDNHSAGSEPSPAASSGVDRPGLVAGVILLVMGSALALMRLEILPLTAMWILWPLLVVALGFFHLLGFRHPEKRRGGAVLILVGLWLLIPANGIAGFGWDTAWPLLLIGIGLLTLLWPKKGDERGSGLVMVAVGVWCLLTVRHFWHLDWGTSWPLLLVLVGSALVLQAILQALSALIGRRS